MIIDFEYQRVILSLLTGFYSVAPKVGCRGIDFPEKNYSISHTKKFVPGSQFLSGFYANPDFHTVKL